jgi:hypothetical protein
MDIDIDPNGPLIIPLSQGNAVSPLELKKAQDAYNEAMGNLARMVSLVEQKHFLEDIRSSKSFAAAKAWIVQNEWYHPDMEAP